MDIALEGHKLSKLIQKVTQKLASLTFVQEIKEVYNLSCEENHVHHMASSSGISGKNDITLRGCLKIIDTCQALGEARASLP